MPELPEVEVIAEYIQRNIVSKGIVTIEAPGQLVLRATLEEVRSLLVGAPVCGARRWGKFLILQAAKGDLVVNFMLAGRLRHCPASERRRKTERLLIGLDDSTELRYIDPKMMGRIYVAKGGDHSHIPGFPDQGPDALDPELDLETFLARLKGRRGQVKGILKNQAVVAGIGTAYSDEILFDAGVFPFRRLTDLNPQEVDRLYTSMREVLIQSIDAIRSQRAPLHEQDRSFMKVHGKSGESCPVCGKAISQITARGEITNFCSRCQPRGRLGGVH